MQEAAQHNVGIDQAVELLEAYEEQQRQGASGLSDKATYVRQLILMEAIDSLHSSKLGVPLLFKGVSGARLHKRSADQAFKEKEEVKLTTLARKAGVAEGESHWEPTDARYREAFAELCEFKVAELQQGIEEHVFKLKLVIADRIASDSKNSRAR